MKSARKILAFALVLVTVLVCISTFTVSAAEGGTTVYLSPNSNWRADNARFAIYVWNDNNSHLWVDMTDSDGDGVYEAVVPEGYNNIIFCRMAPDKTKNSWDNKWNQTDDLIIPENGDNHYKVASGTWDKGGGEWSHFDESVCVHTPSGEGTVLTPADCANEGKISHICSKCGDTYTDSISKLGHSYGADSKCKVCGKEAVYIIAGNVMKANGEYAEGDNSTLFVTEWDTADEYNRMYYDEAAGCFVKIYKNVAKGEYHFKVAEDRSWDVSYGQDGGNCYIKVDEDGSTVTIVFKDGSINVASSRPAPTPEIPDVDIDDSTNDSGNNSDSSAEQKPGFFESIFIAIGNFFKSIGYFFKNLFK